MSKSRAGQKITMMSVDELLGVPQTEGTEEIDISLIDSFKDHPFKVVDDEKMRDLVESIMNNGVLTPVTVRPLDNGRYQMISGHRRKYAAEIAGLDKIPATVKEMDDDEAVIAMVDSNIQREEILPSEKAFAYKMRYEAMKRSVGRKGKNVSRKETQLRSDAELGLQVGESRANIQRYLRLAELDLDLLDLVDRNVIAIQTGVDISYMDAKIQKWLFEYIRDNGVIKAYQITALRDYLSMNDDITQQQMIKLLNEKLGGRVPSPSVTLNHKKLMKYFPAYYSKEEMEQVIEDLLANWKREKGEIK